MFCFEVLLSCFIVALFKKRQKRTVAGGFKTWLLYLRENRLSYVTLSVLSRLKGNYAQF